MSKPFRRDRRGPATPPETVETDRAALLLMLAFVEAECLRRGAPEAARHAALAATLVPETATPRPPRLVALH
jgi:hypothetical protein